MKTFIKRFWLVIVVILLAAVISGLLSDDPLKAIAIFLLQYIHIVLVYLACLMAVRKAISEIRIMEITEEENDKDHG